jgi:membrane protein DedA with SNARE-associated domain
MDQTQKYCKRCATNVLATRKGVNHTFHLWMTVLTCSMWGFVWVWLVLFGGGSWRCPNDGGRL